MPKRICCFFLLFLIAPIGAIAQESMLPSVSPTFLSTLVDYAKMNYPRVKRYRTKADEAVYNIKKAKLGWFEALTFSYTFNPNANSTSTNPNNFLSTSQTGLFINVGSILSISPTLKIARLEKQVAEDELAEVSQNIEAQVKTRYYLYIEKLTVLKIRTRYVEDAEGSFKQVKYKFEKGEETYDNFTKALLLNTISMQNKVEAEGEVLRAKANLEELLGKKLEDIK